MRNKFYARAWSILRPLVMFFLPVELRGTENLGDEAAILCANHSSAWDPILLVLAMPQNFNVRIMAKKQLFSIPVVRWFLRNIGVFPVDRGNSDINAVKTAITSLRDGWNLLIFPEGTRSHDGEIYRFKAGAFTLAREAGVEILPVVLDGTTTMIGRNGMFNWRNKLTVSILPPVSAERVAAADPKELMEQVRASMCVRLAEIRKQK